MEIFCRPALEDLRAYFSDVTDCNIADLDELPTDPRELAATIQMYFIFFPMLEAHDISELNVTVPPISTSNIQDIGAVISDMLTNPGILIQNHKKGLIEHMFGGIAKRLGVSNTKSTLRILAYHSYKYLEDFFLMNNSFKSLFRGCDALEEVNLCESKEERNLTEACLKYCDEMAHAAGFEDQIYEILHMSLKRANMNWEEATNSMLPDCSWRSGGSDCWTQVAMSDGICFSNYRNQGDSFSIFQICAMSCFSQLQNNSFLPKALVAGKEAQTTLTTHTAEY